MSLIDLIDQIRHAQVLAGEGVVVAHLEKMGLGGVGQKVAGDAGDSAMLLELLTAVRRVYDDVGPPGEFGYNTRIGKALANLYDVYNKALAADKARRVADAGKTMDAVEVQP